MCEHAIGKAFDTEVITLARRSSAWFKAHQHIEISQRFIMYVNESQSGCFRQHYAQVLDGSMECLIGVLPLLANHLTAEVSRVVQTPPQKLRPLIGMMVYWLIQFHAGKTDELPDRNEMLDITRSILTNRILSF